MRIVAIIAVVIGLAVAAHAADVVVDVGSVTIPDAAVADVQEWLATDVLYTTVTTIEVRTDPDTGESVNIEHKTKVVVPETPKQKLLRIMQAAAKKAVRDAVRQLRQDRATAAATAEINALPDPVTE